MLKILRYFQVRRAISRMLKQGRREILNGQIMAEFYKWQISIAPEDALKEDIGKLQLKVKQMEDIIANNQKMEVGFKSFLRAQ